MASIKAVFLKNPVGQDSRLSLQVDAQGVQSLKLGKYAPDGVSTDLSKGPAECVVVTRIVQRAGFKSKIRTTSIPLGNVSEVDYGEEEAK